MITVIFDLTARLGAKRDFEVCTYDSGNSTRIKLVLVFYAHWLEMIQFNFWENGIANLTEMILQCGQPCISEAIHWSQPSHTVEKLLFWKLRSQCLLSVKSYLEKLDLSLCCCSACAANRQYITCLPIYFRDLTCFDGLYLKNRVLGQNIDSKFHLGQTKHHSVLSDCPLCSPHITLLLASFDVVLPSESKKPSWINWTIEISPSMCWFLFCWFPACMSRFRASHGANYCGSCAHAVQHCMWRLWRAQKWEHVCTTGQYDVKDRCKVPQHFDGSLANESLFAMPGDLISFTSYGAD